MANDVFYFNPTCELAVANGSFSYMPPSLLREFEHDCSVLPFIFGTSRDFVLTEKIPSKEFVMKLTDAGFEMPEFCTLKELISGKTDMFGSIFPWGWSPAAHFYLKGLKAKCSSEFRESPVYSWKEGHKTLFERITSLYFLSDFLKQNPLDFFVVPELIGSKVTRVEEIEDFLSNHIPLVLKSPISSSGRGIQIIRKQTLNTSNRQWISGILNQQEYLIAEPFLNKVLDFSFQFKISNDEPEYLGYSVFETNSNGQYQSTLIHPDIEKYGRMNMGILTTQIEKKTHDDTTGKFAPFYGSQGEYRRFATNKAMEQPLKISSGKLSSGFLSLVEPGAERQFGAYFSLTAPR